MILKRAFLATMVLVLGTGAMGAAAAPSDPAESLFREWLAAFNTGDAKAIRPFYAAYLDDPDAMFPIENAQDTCGFDLVRVEQRGARNLTVLLAEKCFPSLQRLTIELGEPGVKRLKRFDLDPVKLPPDAAIAALTGITDRLAAKDGFAGAVIIADGKGQPWSRVWGTLGRTDGRRITVDTPMFLASAGKMFTAVAVLQLVQAGKVELDAPLGRYLPDYPNAAMAQVTVRQLLSHRAGAGDIGILGRDEGANRAHVRTIADIIALNGGRPPDFPPGSKADYANYGFVLLGAIVERVSGMGYDDYITAHVFKPAGMHHAGFPDRDHLDGIAQGYTHFYGEEAALVPNRDVLPWKGTPAGGGVASANDMLAFFQALKAGILLTPDLLKQATMAGDTPWYGMGFVVNSGANPSWGHGGNSYGMDVAAHYYPAQDTLFICLATRDMACNRLIFAWYLRRFGRLE